MPISRALLIAGLLAAGLYLSPAKFTRAQQPDTINVRPRVTSNTPGMPTVKATVDRNRVPVGDEVTFTLSPAQVVTDSRYRVTLFFGDGSQQVMREPRKVHLYKRSGTYTYSILVEPAQVPTPTPTPRIAIPDVRIIATPISVEVNRPVNFSAELSYSIPNVRFRFFPGDGSKTDWQASPSTSYVYRLPGNYRAYVDIGIAAKGTITAVGGSKRVPIQVSAPPPPANVIVKLIASATSVKVGDSVNFDARTNPPVANARYRFNFGDQAAAVWQASARTNHRYKYDGNFSARVEVRFANGATGTQSITSDPLTIEVTDGSASKRTVDLEVNPESAPLGLPAFFRAIPSAADSRTRYRFNFGDASSPTEWTSARALIHTYTSAGVYSAFVELGSESGQGVDTLATSATKRVRIAVAAVPDDPNQNINSNPPTNKNSSTPDNSNANTNGNVNSRKSPSASPSETVSPTPIGGPTQPPGDWWKYLIIIAIITFAGYQAASYLLVPRPTLVPHIDPGDADVGAGSLAINLQVDVDPNIAGGEFTVNTGGGSLIKSERTE